MTRDELEHSSSETANRSEISLSAASPDMQLNGPIQGGTHADLREKSSLLMGSAEVDGKGFAIHPIGESCL